MSTSAAFELTAEKMAEECSLTPLALRGALRYALRDAGLDAASVTSTQMYVVIERLVPGYLARMGVDEADSERICRSAADHLSTADLPVPRAHHSRPEALFDRLDTPRRRR